MIERSIAFGNEVTAENILIYLESGVKEIIEGLERIAKNVVYLSETTPTEETPEYQVALDALNKYAQAVGNKVKGLK